jgi:hypothetical protein
MTLLNARVPSPVKAANQKLKFQPSSNFADTQTRKYLGVSQGLCQASVKQSLLIMKCRLQLTNPAYFVLAGLVDYLRAES